MDVQVNGVADALGVTIKKKQVAPGALYRWLAPWGPTDPRDKFGQDGSMFAPPWPDFAIATGRVAIPYLRRLRQLAGPATFTVVLQDPKTGRNTADLIWVPAHDKLRGSNVISTLTAPHGFTTARLKALKNNTPPEIAALSSPRIAVMLGGKNAVYRFTEDDDRRLERALSSFARLGASFMVTPSRRTHQRLIGAVRQATEGAPRIIWDGTGDNPYGDFLANADMLIVTADSVNMTGEACATGRPVYVFTPSGGSAKFNRFHAALRDQGATRVLSDEVDAIETWAYDPILSADFIAGEIHRRWQRRQQMIGGYLARKARSG